MDPFKIEVYPEKDQLLVNNMRKGPKTSVSREQGDVEIGGNFQDALVYAFQFWDVDIWTRAPNLADIGTFAVHVLM